MKTEVVPGAAKALHDRVLRLLQASASARSMNMQLLRAADGEVALGFTITESMINSSGVCQGGYIFSLGDTAAAYACLTRHSRAATQWADIAFVAAARPGERVCALATEVARARRSAVYDVRITDSTDKVIALMRAHFHLFEPAAAGSR